MAIQVKAVPSGRGYDANCYIVFRDGYGVVIDPCSDVSPILDTARSLGVTLTGVWLTHGHFDHIGGIDAIRRAVPGLPVAIHGGDAPMLSSGERNGHAFFFGGSPDAFTRNAPDTVLSDQQVLSIGNGDESFRVLHTPGHSPGSVCFYAAKEGILLTGDTLFIEGIGRWDLWGGDPQPLSESLAFLESLRRAVALDPNAPPITVYPGHGPSGSLTEALGNASLLGYL